MEVPIAQPVATPVMTPVSTPIATPVTAPVAAPMMTPVNIPIATPLSVPVSVPVIIPILECFEDLQNGSFVAYFGYNNTRNEQIEVPVGSTNTFGSPSFIGQPTTFIAGRSGASFVQVFEK